MTPNPDFKVTPLFDAVSETVRDNTVTVQGLTRPWMISRNIQWDEASRVLSAQLNFLFCYAEIVYVICPPEIEWFCTWSQKLTDSLYKVLLRATYVVVRCPSVRPSVCLSVRFVCCIETSKHHFRRLQTNHSSFSYQTFWQYSDGTPLTGVSHAGAVEKSAIFYQ